MSSKSTKKNSINTNSLSLKDLASIIFVNGHRPFGKISKKEILQRIGDLISNENYLEKLENEFNNLKKLNYNLTEIIQNPEFNKYDRYNG